MFRFFMLLKFNLNWSSQKDNIKKCPLLYFGKRLIIE